MANIFEPEFDSGMDREGFEIKRAQMGPPAGAERLGASMFELAPGSAAFPMHFHLGNEEMLIVLSGCPVLRTLEGERELAAGEVVGFPVGEAGAHQVVNRSTDPVRILLISEMNAPDVVIRPESQKLSAFGRPPGSSAEGIHDVYFRRDSVDMWDGELPPPPADG